jgi:hypothetical protein
MKIAVVAQALRYHRRVQVNNDVLANIKVFNAC